MPIVTESFAHTPLFVDAVQVTDENMADAAVWCEGTCTTNDEKIPYIKVDVIRPLRTRQTMAFAGDWILRTGTGFKVYTNNAFRKSFVPVKEVSRV